MANDRVTSNLSFRARMLLAVTAVIAVLVAISLWLVSQRVKKQINDNAKEQLVSAEGVLTIRQATREIDLFTLCNGANNEPKFQSALQLLADEKATLSPEGRATINNTLDEMHKATQANVIVLTPASDLSQHVAVPPEIDAG